MENAISNQNTNTNDDLVSAELWYKINGITSQRRRDSELYIMVGGIEVLVHPLDVKYRSKLFNTHSPSRPNN
jgi:hypothetical protein